MQLLVLETLAAKRPSVMLLQDLRTSVGRRARIIKDVESAAPHYKVFIDGSRAGPTGYPFTLMTIVHRSLHPPDSTARASAIDCETWPVPAGRAHILLF